MRFIRFLLLVALGVVLLGLPALAMAAPAAGVVAVRDGDGNRTTFTMVTEALQQSQGAVRVDVGAGSYDERVVVRNRTGLTLRGHDGAMLSGLVLRGNTDVRVRGFAIDATGLDKPAVQLLADADANSQLRLVDISVLDTDEGRPGVVVAPGNHDVVLRRVDVHSAGGAGMSLRGSFVRVVDSKVEGAGTNGVIVGPYDSAQSSDQRVVLRRVTVHAAASDGVVARDGARLHLVDSALLRNGRHGLRQAGVDVGAYVVLRNTVSLGNAVHGVLITEGHEVFRAFRSSFLGNGGYGLKKKSEQCSANPRWIRLEDTSVLSNGGRVRGDSSSADLSEHCSILDDRDEAVTSTTGDEPFAELALPVQDYLSDSELLSGDYGGCEYTAASDARGVVLGRGAPDGSECQLTDVTKPLVAGDYRLQAWLRSDVDFELAAKLHATEEVEVKPCDESLYGGPVDLDLPSPSNIELSCDDPAEPNTCSGVTTVAAGPLWQRLDICFGVEGETAVQLALGATDTSREQELVVEEWALHSVIGPFDPWFGGPRPGPPMEVSVYATGYNSPVATEPSDPKATCVVHDPETNTHYSRLGPWPQGNSPEGATVPCEAGLVALGQIGPDEFYSLSFVAAAMGDSIAPVLSFVGVPAPGQDVELQALQCSGANVQVECDRVPAHPGASYDEVSACSMWAEVLPGRTWQAFNGCFEVASGELAGLQVVGGGAELGSDDPLAAPPVVIDDFIIAEQSPATNSAPLHQDATASSDLLDILLQWQITEGDSAGMKAALPDLVFASRPGSETPFIEVLTTVPEYAMDVLQHNLHAPTYTERFSVEVDYDAFTHTWDGLRIAYPEGMDSRHLPGLFRGLHRLSLDIGEGSFLEVGAVRARADGEHPALAAVGDCALLDTAEPQPWLDPVTGEVAVELGLRLSDLGLGLDDAKQHMRDLAWSELQPLRYDIEADRLVARGSMELCSWQTEVALMDAEALPFTSAPLTHEERGLAKATLPLITSAIAVEECNGLASCVGTVSRLHPVAAAEEAKLGVGAWLQGDGVLDALPPELLGWEGWDARRAYYPDTASVVLEGVVDVDGLRGLLRGGAPVDGPVVLVPAKGAVEWPGGIDPDLSGSEPGLEAQVEAWTEGGRISARPGKRPVQRPS